MLNMMIVEDDKDTLEILHVILMRKFSGVSCRVASNGREALELFERHPAEIVVTDVNMPEMGGVELAKAIRGMRPEVPFVFITADTGRKALELSIGPAFDQVHYITKPVVYQDLFQAVEQALAEAARHRAKVSAAEATV